MKAWIKRIAKAVIDFLPAEGELDARGKWINKQHELREEA